MIEKFIRRLPDARVANWVISGLNDAYLRYSDFHKLRSAREAGNDVETEGQQPLISVYTPTFNRCNLLIERAVQSVLSQSYENFEYLIIDDGSTDDTRSLVMDIGDPRIKYIYNDRVEYRYPQKSINHWLAGPVVAANLGLSLATGSWIARIDDDDLWTEDHLELLLTEAIAQQVEFISSDILIEDSRGSKVVTPFDNPKDPTGIGATQTWMYKSYLSVFRYNIHCWRKSYFAVNDTDLQYRMFAAGVRIGYLPKVTARIVPRPGEDFIGSLAYINNKSYYEKFYS